MKIALTLALALDAATAVAQSTSVATARSSPVDYAELRTKCADFLANASLTPPQGILTCMQERTVWRPVAGSPAGRILSETRVTTTASVALGDAYKTYGTIARTEPVASEHCRIEQYKEVVSVDVAVSCADLEAVDAAALSDRCVLAIEHRLLTIPSDLETQGTDVMVDVCL